MEKYDFIKLMLQNRNLSVNDKKRLEEMEQGNKVTQRAILALLSHGIDGNDIEAMKAAKKELQDFLIGK